MRARTRGHNTGDRQDGGRLLLRLVQPPAAVPGPAVGRHPLLLAADVLETLGPSLLDRVDLEIHLPADLVRNPSQEGAVPRPVAPVRGARPGVGVRPPVDTGSRARAHGADEGLLLAAGLLGLLHVGRHGAAAEALAHARASTCCAARKRSGSAVDSSAQWTCRPRSTSSAHRGVRAGRAGRRARGCRLAEG